MLDTDILSEISRAKNPVVVRHARTYRKAMGHFSLSAVTVAEITSGYQRVQANARLVRFLQSITSEEVIPLDRVAAELAGRIAGDLDRNGQTIGLPDAMIAATAIIHDLTLVTGNTAHFDRVRRLGFRLSLANWRV